MQNLQITGLEQTNYTKLYFLDFYSNCIDLQQVPARTSVSRVSKVTVISIFNYDKWIVSDNLYYL